MHEPERRGAPILLGAKEAATLLGIGERSLWRYNANGKVPAPVRLGGRILWRRGELADWTAAGCPPRSRWAWPTGGKR